MFVEKGGIFRICSHFYGSSPCFQIYFSFPWDTVMDKAEDSSSDSPKTLFN